jgi:nucleoside-diphosphate-sugar epimerase/predicted dehydrogenase
MTTPAPNRTPTSTPALVGVVGLGFISEFHTSALRKLFGQDVHLCGVDLSSAVRDGAVGSGQVDSAARSVADLIDRRPDAVHVLVPPQHHASTTIPFIEAEIDVLLEKPLASSAAECAAIAAAAAGSDVLVATSHNQLFYDVWDRARSLIALGAIGEVRGVDMVSRRPLGFLRVGDTRPWMMHGATNVLFEVAPHAFAQVLDVVGELEVCAATPIDPQQLPNGVEFHRSWNITARSGTVPISIQMSFDDAFSQTTIVVRGSLGAVTVDFDLNTIDVKHRSSAPFDLEKLNQAVKSSASVARSAITTFGDVVASKAGIGLRSDPFSGSVLRSIQSFYDARPRRTLDRRHELDFGERVVGVATQAAAASGLDAATSKRAKKSVATTTTKPTSTATSTTARSRRGPCDVVVFGGTGFIGSHLVRRLAQDAPVRVVARRPEAARLAFAGLDVDVVDGDLRSTDSLSAAVDGARTVFNLSFGGGSTWVDLESNDVAPALALADACESSGVRRMIYASSIAVYNAGVNGGVITERTPADPDVLRVAPYARSKAVVEDELLARSRAGRLPVVIARPGIVLGVESDPCHWGIAAWPHTNVCQHWGSGDHALPIVLVEDVADALAVMVSAEGIAGESFNLCAATDITARDYVDELARCSGSPIMQETTNPRARHIASLAKWSIKRLGAGDTPVPAYADAAGRTFASRFDCSKARDRLGWSPVDDRGELLRRGVCEVAHAWY